MNQVKTVMLFAALAGVFMALGYAFGGQGGMVIAFVVALGINLFSYWNSDKIVLRMHGAQAVDESHPSHLVRTYVGDVLNLAQRAGPARPENLYSGNRSAERLRDGSRSRARRRLRHHRLAEHAVARGSRWRDGA